jgi:mRNA interferase MazF
MPTAGPMGIFEQGAVVRVPFPYTDRPVRQHRPALVISSNGLGEGQKLLWVLMITSVENRPWPGDVSFGKRYSAAGLPVPSVIRTAKIATIDIASAEEIGSADPLILQEVIEQVRGQLAL